MHPAMIMLTDVGFDTDSVGWLLTQELIKSVLLGQFIDIGPALWVFIGVLSAFAVTRGITRFIRHRSASGVVRVLPATHPGARTDDRV